MNSKFLVWLRKNTWMTFIFSIVLGIIYFILCMFIGHLINIYIYKYHFFIYGMIVAVLFQYPMLKGINKIDMKYKISKPYQDK